MTANVFNYTKKKRNEYIPKIHVGTNVILGKNQQSMISETQSNKFITGETKIHRRESKRN